MKLVKDRADKIAAGLIYLFIVLYFMRFLNFPNALVVILGGIICLFAALRQKTVRIDFGVVFIILTMVSYYLISNGGRGILFSILYIPVVMYVLANYMVHSVYRNDQVNKNIFLLLFLLVLGYAIHGLLNAGMWYMGYVIPGTRQWQDFWSGEIVPGTQHVAYFLPMLALFFPVIMYFKENILLGSLVIVSTVFFCYTSLATKSRGVLLIFVLVLFLQVILFLFFEWKKLKNIFFQKKLWLIIPVIILLSAVAVFLIKDNEMIIAFAENMGKGGGIFNNIRFQAQRKALEQLFVYPMGGGKMDFGGISHAHNVWLDMANVAGLIPFCLFTIYTVYSFINIVCLLNSKLVSTEMKLMLAGVYAAFFLYFTIETALEASIHLVAPWFYVNGLIQGILSKERNKKEGVIYVEQRTEG